MTVHSLVVALKSSLILMTKINAKKLKIKEWLKRQSALCRSSRILFDHDYLDQA